MSGWLATRSRDSWTLRLAALWLGLTLAYMLSAPTDITFEDTPLFAGACATLGLPHPPGYPLYVWGCFPLTWLFGALGWSQALGTTLFSALCVATACVLLAMLIRRVTGVPALALFAAGLLGLAPSVWDQAQIPEVYGLNLALLMLCWYLCQRFVEDGKRCWLYALAGCTGLGVAAHWPLFVLSYPFLLLWLGQSWPRLLELARDRRVIGYCLALFAIGLLPYAHLLLVSDEAFAFDQNYHSGKVFAYVSREIYGVGGTYLPWPQRVGQAALTSVWFMREYLYLFGLAVPLGLYVLWQKGERWQFAAVVCGMLMTTVFLCLVRPYDKYSEIGVWVFHAYPLPAYAVAALPLALGLGRLLSLTRWKQGNVAVVAVALIGVALWQFPVLDRSDEKIAAKHARLVLQGVPKDALVLNFTNDFGFALRYVNYFENLRSGLELVRESDFIEDIDDGVVSAADEKKLLAEPRPVVFLNKLEFKEVGVRFAGTHFLLDKDQAAGSVSVDIDDEARQFVGRLYELRQQGVRNAFSNQFVRNSIANFVTVLEGARLHGKQLDIKDLSLLELLGETPEGKFALFLAFTLDNPQSPSVSQLEGEVAKLRPHWQTLSPTQRSDVLHLLAIARLFDNNKAGALEALRLAFEELPRAENQRVLIDLLQVISTEGGFEEYERLRKRYRELKSGTALDAYDAKCEEALRRECAISLK